MFRRPSFVAIFVALSAVALTAGPAQAATFGDTVQPLGSEEVVFDKSVHGDCGVHEYADQPARAYRTADGRIALTISSSFFNGRMIGTSFSNLVPEHDLPGKNCNDAQTAGGTNTHPSDTESTGPPQNYHASEWIGATYSFPSINKVVGLVHNEWFGTAPQYCQNNDRAYRINTCWMSSVTELESNDGGASYDEDGTPPAHLVAALPYRYVNDWGVHGFGETTNIVFNELDEHFYMFVPVRSFASNPYPPTAPPNTPQAFGAQKKGMCVMRSDSLGDPSSWRAWDGNAGDDQQNGFTRRFINPYLEPNAPPAQHVCEPITGFNQFTPESVTWSTYFNKWLLVGTRHNPQPNGVYYATSDNLVNWTPLKLLMQRPTAAAYKVHNNCQGEKPFAYPSVIDHSDSSSNFERSGQVAYLYYTRFNDFNSNCDPQADRDLIRIPIRFSNPRLATFEGGNAFDPSTGFDHGLGSLSAYPNTQWPGVYEGSKAARAVYFPGQPAQGFFNDSLPNGSESWYGSAFYIHSSFASNDNVALMEWSNTARTVHGGFSLRTDNLFHVVRGNTANPNNDQNVGPAVTLPTNRWSWVEIRQKLNQSSPLTEVFLDGRPLFASTAPNSFPDSAGVPSRVGFGFGSNQANVSDVNLDRSSIALRQRGPAGAPPAPTGFTGSGQDRTTIMYWNASAGATGYRIYRLGADGVTWVGVFDGTTTAFIDTYLTNCTTYQYRLTAYNAQVQVGPSESLALTPKAPGQTCP